MPPFSPGILCTIHQLSDRTYTRTCVGVLTRGGSKEELTSLLRGHPRGPATMHGPSLPETHHLGVASTAQEHQEAGAGEEGRAPRQAAAPQIQPSSGLWASLPGSPWETWVSQPQAPNRVLNLELSEQQNSVGAGGSHGALAASFQAVPPRSLIHGLWETAPQLRPWQCREPGSLGGELRH